MRLPNTQIRVIPNAGHALPYDQPDIFMRKTLDFLSADANARSS